VSLAEPRIGCGAAGDERRLQGPVQFNGGGVATVAKGTDSVTVRGLTLTDTSLVLAILQAYAKAVAIADVAAGSVTIYLTKVVKAAVAVAWFVIG
jgi:hypothetical protein